MTRTRLILAGLILCATAAFADVPSAIQVPDGHAAFLTAHAVGTQNYTCVLGTNGAFSWKFIGPQATLIVTVKWFSGDIQQQVSTHFLSPNPKEEGTARATWQSSIDTSAVWGNAIANSNDPTFVAVGAIPWLLLQVVGSKPGVNGGEMFTPATYIQRINTVGGLSPSAECSESRNNGVTMFVPYTADYVFYRSNRK